MKIMKKTLYQIMLVFFLYASTHDVFGSIQRCSKPLAATVKLGAMHAQQKALMSSFADVGRSIAQYHQMDNTAKVLPQQAWVSKKCAFKADVLDFVQTYEDESHQAFINDDPELRRKVLYPALYEKYTKEYAQKQDALHAAAVIYHEERYPQVCQDLDITRGDKESDLLRKIYNESYNDYTQAPTMGKVYNLGKSLNALELRAEDAGQKIQLKNYLTSYVHNNFSNKRYQLKDVQFCSLDPQGVPCLINGYRQYADAICEPSIKKITFASNLFTKHCLSEQAFIAMHEVKHLEHMSGGYEIPFMNERQADLHAAQECNCPVCLKIKAKLTRTNPDNGYLSADEFKIHAAHAQHRCKAHNEHDTTELEKALESGNSYKIKKLDNGMGTIYDRLPVVPKS